MRTAVSRVPCVVAVDQVLGRVEKLGYVIDSDVELDGVKSHVG